MRALVIHRQINLIKFVESNKFNKVYTAKFESFCLINFLKNLTCSNSSN